MQNNFDQLESKPMAQFLAYSIPAIVAMLLTSGIVIVDGLFIGNFIGKVGLASVNLTLPVLYLFLGIAIMIGVGGAVNVGHALGARRQGRADRHFSVTVALTLFIIGALASIEAYIVFPTVAVGTVMLIILIARFVFRETMTLPGYIGIVLTIASIIALASR